MSGAVGMKFGIRKCAVAHLRNGKVAYGGNVGLDVGKRIEEVEEYKYLGVSQLMGALKKTLARVGKEFCRRQHRVWGSALSARRKVIYMEP